MCSYNLCICVLPHPYWQPLTVLVGLSLTSSLLQLPKMAVTDVSSGRQPPRSRRKNVKSVHFPSSPPCFLLQLQIAKHKGEILGVVIVESGWGSILPTVILANMMNGGPAARSGKLSIGDQIMSINGTSLVGLPLATCQGIIKVPFPSPWLRSRVGS